MRMGRRLEEEIGGVGFVAGFGVVSEGEIWTVFDGGEDNETVFVMVDF